jgi:hypothetical protein
MKSPKRMSRRQKNDSRSLRQDLLFQPPAIRLNIFTSRACIIAMIGSRLHNKAGNQNYDLSSFVGSVLEPSEIRTLFAFKGLPDIFASLFSSSFCRSRLLEFHFDRLLATNKWVSVDCGMPVFSNRQFSENGRPEFDF